MRVPGEVTHGSLGRRRNFDRGKAAPRTESRIGRAGGSESRPYQMRDIERNLHLRLAGILSVRR